ncbi:MAG: 3-oxoacyl-ACP synthase, partial [Proteobacteria bacterium]|nr:3-oxoacyl-ACP synthase [Pseudomonadota bacterium]
DDGNKPVAVVKDVILAADGGLGDLLTVGGGSASTYQLGDPIREDFFVQLVGSEVYKNAVRSMSDISKELLAKHNLTIDDVDVLLPHQANLRIMDAVGKKLNIPTEKVFCNIERYGNTSAGSVPIALTEARNSGFIKENERMLICAFGAGFTWGAALLEF